MNIQPVFSGKTHKEKESIEDCQDAYAVSDGAFAIADGASQSFYSSVWANMLVGHFCKNPNVESGNWQNWLVQVQDDWLKEVKNRVVIAKENGKPSWIDNQNRLNRFESATATFIGVRFDDQKIKIMLVGDSCLFVVRKDKIVKSLLFDKPSDFNDAPGYLASYAKDNNFRPVFLETDIKELQGCYFMLATDALAEWILKTKEAGKNIVPDLLGLSSQTSFEAFISNAREASQNPMKNDDVTLLVFKILAKKPLNETQYPLGGGIIDVEAATKEVEPTKEKEASQKNEPSEKEHFEELNTETKELQKKLASLRRKNKYFKISLGVMSIFLVVSVCFNLYQKNASDKLYINDKVEVSKKTILENKNKNNSQDNTPKPFSLQKGDVVYLKEGDGDEAQLAKPLTAAYEATQIKEDNEWITFEIDLYANKTITSSCNKCAKNEIVIKPLDDNNIRTSTSFADDSNIFGQLKKPVRFSLTTDTPNNKWYKFKFVGRTKKKNRL